MIEIVLYMVPGTCARLTAIALEELELPFECRVIRFMKGEHKSSDFKQKNPKGKVPCLVQRVALSDGGILHLEGILRFCQSCGLKK